LHGEVEIALFNETENNGILILPDIDYSSMVANFQQISGNTLMGIHENRHEQNRGKY
jgi:hypothetical protein